MLKGEAMTPSTEAVRLDGRVAIVTGSGRSLGRAYALALADAGAAVVVNDVDAVTAAETVAAITSTGGRAVAVVAPVGPASTAEALVDAAPKLIPAMVIGISRWIGFLAKRVPSQTSVAHFSR